MVLALAPRLLSGALRLLSATVRMRYIHGERLFDVWDRQQVLLTFWHNRVLMLPLAAQGQKICIMNSQSRDGEIATLALERWGIHSVRGSATRGGTSGFLQLVRAFRSGYHLAVVPDGPRGPRYEVKPGVLHLARATGAPLIPIAYGASSFRQIRSWDRLLIPLPFATITYVIGQPLTVPRRATDDELVSLRDELESRLRQVTEQADRVAGRRQPE